MKNVIVTGATGFIGSSLVKELIKSKYYVYAVVRPGTKNIDKIKGLNNCSIVEIDMNSISNIQSILKDIEFEYFFHIAWEGVSGKLHTDYEVQLRNVKNAVECVKSAKELGCKRFIGAGSLHERECSVELSEKRSIKNDRNFYKIAKLMAHYYCKVEASLCDIDFLWPILTNTYGEGEFSERLINSTIRKLEKGIEPNFTKGDQLYDFIYITDVARAYRLIAEKGISFEEYIISSGNIQPLKNYLMEIGKTIAPNINLNFGTVGSGVYLSKEDLYNENLYRDTGFKPKINFKDGIIKTAKWLSSI